MKRFIGFVKKEIYHILRDRRSLFILFGMPIAQILLFGFAITNEINHVKIAILDRSNDEQTKEIIQKINATSYFTVEEYLYRMEDIEKIFKSGRVKAVLVFDKNTAKDLTKEGKTQIQLLTDATEPNTANTIVNYINAILQSYQVELNQNEVKPYQIAVESKMLYNPELKSVYMFVPGVMTIVLMLVSAMMTSISIAKEKEIGTMEILLVSPLHPFQVVIGKVFPYIFLSIVNATVILLLGVLVFKMPINGSMALLAFETVLFIISALSLGLLISTISKTQQTAMMISMVGLMLPVIILSGFIFTISSMPWPLQVISNIVPAKWFIISIKGIMLKGIGIQLLWKETLIMMVMTLIFLGLSIRNYKIRLE
jgi:ABC-2 type transport system permease protein